MPTLNDEILRVTGGPSVNDGLLAYYKANGAGSLNNIQDAERVWLGVQIGSLNSTSTTSDLWRSFGAFLGFTGTVNDIQLRFWSAQP